MQPPGANEIPGDPHHPLPAAPAVVVPGAPDRFPREVPVPHVEIVTSFGTVTASEEALAEAVLELLRSEQVVDLTDDAVRAG